VPPGKYTVRLTAGGKTVEQPLTVRMDPTVRIPDDVLSEQFQLSYACWSEQRAIRAAQVRLLTTRRQMAEISDKADDDLKTQLAEFDAALAAIVGPAGRGGRRGEPRPRTPTLGRVAADLGSLLSTLQGADAKPTTVVVKAVPSTLSSAREVLRRLEELRSKSLPPLNEKIRKAGLAELSIEKGSEP
jgi:hypothetical protein